MEAWERAQLLGGIATGLAGFTIALLADQHEISYLRPFTIALLSAAIWFILMTFINLSR